MESQLTHTREEKVFKNTNSYNTKRLATHKIKLLKIFNIKADQSFRRYILRRKLQ